MSKIFDEKQIRAINLTNDTAERLYQQHIENILQQYLTSEKQVNGWRELPKEERWEQLNVYLSDLEPRSIQQIGEQYIGQGSAQFKTKVINKVIQYAEERGKLDHLERQQEIEFRQEVYAYKKVIGRYGIHGLTTVEIRRNAKKGSEAGSSKGGIRSYKLGLGVHGLALDELVANGSRGGLKAKKEGKGIFADGYDTTAAARAGAIARGQVIYSDAEKELIQSLVQNPNYLLLKYNPPRPSWEKIATAITEELGVVRKKMSVRKCYEKLMKKKEE